MAIKTTVCGQSGHEIDAIVVGETQIPGREVWAKKFEVLCIKCGTSLEDIRKEGKSRSGTPRSARKPKLPDVKPVANEEEIRI